MDLLLPKEVLIYSVKPGGPSGAGCPAVHGQPRAREKPIGVGSISFSREVLEKQGGSKTQYRGGVGAKVAAPGKQGHCCACAFVAVAKRECIQGGEKGQCVRRATGDQINQRRHGGRWAKQRPLRVGGWVAWEWGVGACPAVESSSGVAVVVWARAGGAGASPPSLAAQLHLLPSPSSAMAISRILYFCKHKRPKDGKTKGWNNCKIPKIDTVS